MAWHYVPLHAHTLHFSILNNWFNICIYLFSIGIMNKMYPYLSERLLSPGMWLTSRSVGLAVYESRARVCAMRHISVSSPWVGFPLARRIGCILLGRNGRETRRRRHLNGNHLPRDIRSTGRIIVSPLELIRGTLRHGRYTHVCIRVLHINKFVPWNRSDRPQLSWNRLLRQLLTLHLLHWHIILSRKRLPRQYMSLDLLHRHRASCNRLSRHDSPLDWLHLHRRSWIRQYMPVEWLHCHRWSWNRLPRQHVPVDWLHCHRWSWIRLPRQRMPVEWLHCHRWSWIRLPRQHVPVNRLHRHRLHCNWLPRQHLSLVWLHHNCRAWHGLSRHHLPVWCWNRHCYRLARSRWRSRRLFVHRLFGHRRSEWRLWKRLSMWLLSCGKLLLLCKLSLFIGMRLMNRVHIDRRGLRGNW